MFSQQLTLRHTSEPGRFIDPFRVEVHMRRNACPPEILRQILQEVLEEVHVLSDGDYFFNGKLVLCYTVFPYRSTLAQVRRRFLARELAWGARYFSRELALDLSQASIHLLPCESTSPPSVPRQPQALSRRAIRKHQSLPEVRSSCGSPYMEPLPSQSPPYLRSHSSNSSAYRNLVQPAVTHLVSNTKKKRAKGLPADYRSRQNLVQLKHDKAIAMLRPWLLDETQKKIFLRGENVSFIQVKCPSALHVVDDFLEQILNDELIEIISCTVPKSRKRQGQLKGYLIYLHCKTPANVARINEIFEKNFADSGLKCKVARFEKAESESSVEETSV